MPVVPNTSQPNPAIFSDYRPLPGTYCEVFDQASAPRDHWNPIISAFDRMQPAALAQREDRANRMRHEDGTTYNPFDDPDKRAITWSLDMIPLPLTTGEWSLLESAIRQRATLLEKILADVYGRQDLLKAGKLPAELIFANPRFLRACHGIVPSGNRYLTYYAIDVYRGADGKFRVLRDYAEQPAGLGYALENRIVISRLFPELYHNTQIRRLAPFFQMFHRSMVGLTSSGRYDPGAVLLSPGPDSRVYFEHALLSRYLGYPLVEGQDLSVRNGRVYQKKLAGLEPVDLIFRHIGDGGSDPFELRREISAGVTGLLQAVREQNVDIVNPIGSGFIDTPLLSLFLPELCSSLLNESLLLENHPAWWCGNRKNREYVLGRLNELHLHGALDRDTKHSPSDPEQAMQAIAKAPYNWLAHEPLVTSTVPVWENGALAPHSCLMRLFACATDEGFQVMPGGLAIMAQDVEILEEDRPEEQKSKDIWILSDQPVAPFSMLSSLHAVAEFKRGNDLPSRVADNLLWLGRYLERSEGQVRLLRSVYRRLSGEARPEDIPELDFLLSLLRTSAVIPTEDVKDELKDLDKLLSLLHLSLSDKSRMDNAVSSLVRVQETARNVRDRLSLDCWRVINHLERFIDSADSDPLDTLEDILFTLSSFSGLAMESMTRGLGWRFMDMGRRVERALNQNRIIRAGLQRVCDSPYSALEALLEVSDSIMTYRGRYRTTFQLAPVLDLLIMDETNPKSLAFQFGQLADHVEHLPKQTDRRYAAPEERLTLEMLTGVRLLDLTAINCGDNDEDRKRLFDFLDKTKTSLIEFEQHITAHYLTRVPPTPHFSALFGDRNE